MLHQVEAGKAELDKLQKANQNLNSEINQVGVVIMESGCGHPLCVCILV